MRLLAVIRQTRALDVALTSIRAQLETHQIDALWLRTGRDQGERYQNGTERLQLARAMCLAGPYTALLVIDDDLVLPIDFMSHLTDEFPVLMGLTVRRTKPHLWSAVIRAQGITHYTTLDQDVDLMTEVWGQRLKVVGCGHNPTLIRRDVLERIPFRREPGEHGADRYFAWDCQRAGIELWCDTGLVVGHCTGSEIVYPCPAPPYYRIERWD